MSWQLLGATVVISGVGFWNPARTTRGALPNGAELRQWARMGSNQRPPAQSVNSFG
jgi:hypothetical protein